MYFTLELNRLLRRVYRSGFFVCVPLLFLVVCLLEILYPDRNVSHLLIIYSACGIAYAISCMGSLAGPIAVLEEEFSDQTWDFQRTSALSPSALVFGKVIGGCASFWYTYLVSSAALFIAVIYSPNATHVSSAWRVMITVGVMMVFTSTFGFVAALERLRNMRESGRDPSSYNPHFWRIVAAVPILLLHWLVWGVEFESKPPSSLSWYGASFSFLLFLWISLLGWSAVLLGVAIRLLRDEFQYRQYPIVFPVVCLLMTTYFAGFATVPSPHVVHRICLVLFVLSIPACLLLVPRGGRTMLKVRVFIESVRSRRWESAFRFFPLVAWPLLFLFVSFISVEMTTVHRMRGIPTMITLLLVRDLSFGLGLFLLSERRYRFFGLPLLTFLAIMYVAIPVLASTLGLSPLIPYFDIEGPGKDAARMPKILVTFLESVLALIFAVSEAKREIYGRSAEESLKESHPAAP